MGWFNKKEKRSIEGVSPSLPELPRLPELPEIGEEKDNINSIPQLPSFPNNSLGDKFSQDTIKEAVTGKKEGEGFFKANDLTEGKKWMMQKTLKKQVKKEFPSLKKEILVDKEIKETPREIKGVMTKAEPVFIRIDKFEDSMQIFEKAKEKILEVEKMLADIKRIKEEEEKELISWENQIQTTKGQIEKIDKELFSKLE